MHENETLSEIKKEWHGSLKSYLIGFTLSLIFTGFSFFLVAMHFAAKTAVMYTIAALAIVQATAQLLFFLHVGKEAKPRWETMIFLFMVLVLLIIVLGSLWIMYDLNQRVM